MQFLESPFDEAVAALNTEQQEGDSQPATGSAVGPDLVQMSAPPWGVAGNTLPPVAASSPPPLEPPAESVRATRTVNWGNEDKSDEDS